MSGRSKSRAGCHPCQDRAAAIYKHFAPTIPNWANDCAHSQAASWAVVFDHLRNCWELMETIESYVAGADSRTRLICRGPRQVLVVIKDLQGRPAGRSSSRKRSMAAKSVI